MPCISKQRAATSATAVDNDNNLSRVSQAGTSPDNAFDLISREHSKFGEQLELMRGFSSRDQGVHAQLVALIVRKIMRAREGIPRYAVERSRDATPSGKCHEQTTRPAANQLAIDIQNVAIVSVPQDQVIRSRAQFFRFRGGDSGARESALSRGLSFKRRPAASQR
ncbi:hypothetical protein Bphy_5666 (plasmid) [Paraburkholderia phymatum STM815]|uniref:Uncharacterized protein n=1 Tax=Paraburkholderia phymatum (strain DSM 17167 / CIP 108236 / LMG 21445 / STM815) TaxID=391038 RepID=B2JUW1_PARP8|nr:hypothetical protein Bphy_5666 [Paraburkholderia phymatum STM815]